MAVTALEPMYQWAEITSTALGRGTEAPRERQASVYWLCSRAFMGLPWPTKADGMRVVGSGAPMLGIVPVASSAGQGFAVAHQAPAGFSQRDGRGCADRSEADNHARRGRVVSPAGSAGGASAERGAVDGDPRGRRQVHQVDRVVDAPGASGVCADGCADVHRHRGVSTCLGPRWRGAPLRGDLSLGALAGAVAQARSGVLIE